ncbi:hypothetical protein Taro_020549 [Colocasia esculenta]|uniref:SHSP domain-containing protein n=1 Tax=Colocasia esculenta TaxID=4460 RepID=A0A843V8S8_COLES|nr:hypothetical protein [Colocasia esculenta]
MALSRLCWKTNSLFPKSLAVLPHRSPSSSLSPSQLCRAHQCYFSNSAATPCRPLNLRQLARELPFRGFAAAAGSTSPASSSEQEKTGEISTTVSTDSDKPAPEWKRERGGLRRRRNRSRRDLVPFGGGGFGSALWQATEGMNRLLRSLSPWHLFRRLKDEDKAYKLQLEVPGLSKDDLRVTVEDNYLVIRGEKKQEADQESRDEEGE